MARRAGSSGWSSSRWIGRRASAGHRARALSITPLDRPGPTRTGRTAPVTNQAARQFVALLIDHEGRFAVRAAIEGPLGQAVVDADVEATYDLRPAPIMLAVYLMPFVLVGLLWGKLLLARRRGRQRTDDARASPAISVVRPNGTDPAAGDTVE